MSSSSGEDMVSEKTSTQLKLHTRAYVSKAHLEIGADGTAAIAIMFNPESGLL